MSDSLHKKIDFLFDKRFCEFALTSLVSDPPPYKNLNFIISSRENK